MAEATDDQYLLTRLLSVLVLSKTALRHHRPQINPEFWTAAPALKLIATAILDLFDKIQAPPTKQTLLHELVQVRKIKNPELIQEVVRQVYAANPKEAANYYEETLVKMIQAAAYQFALDQSQKLFSEGKFDEIDRLWLKASSVQFAEPVVDTDPGDADLDVLLDEDTAAYDRRKLCPTGYASYDKLSKGGIAAGELHVVVAPPNSGKSRWMINVGGNVAVSGRKVIYVTMEMAAGMVRDRYWQILTNLSVEALRTAEGRDAVKRALAAVRSRGGLFHIIKFDEFSMSFRQLEAYIRAQSTEYDLIITDYMDLFTMESRPSGNFFVDQGFMYHEGRRMGRRLDVGHLSACQPIDKHGMVIALRGMSGGKGKGAAVDVMTSLNATEAEEVSGKQTQFCGKNRVGPRNVAWSLTINKESGVIREVDGSTSDFSVDETAFQETE